MHTLANGFFGLHSAVAHGVCLIFEQPASQIMFYVFLQVSFGFLFVRLYASFALHWPAPLPGDLIENSIRPVQIFWPKRSSAQIELQLFI